MTIGAISFQPYVYNVNAISSASMNRLSGISDNVLDKKTDYSDLSKAVNENPLKPGQTLDFKSMLEMQMQRGRGNASRLMRPVREEESGAQGERNETQEKEQTKVAAKFGQADAAQVQPESEAASENAQMNVQTTAFDGNDAGSGISNFRMQMAISAYEMFMTA